VESRVGSLSAEYRRREPEESLLHRIVREHVNTFFALAEARSADGRGLPKYVRNAFTAYLDCGVLARGFALMRCPGCGHEAAVAYS